MDFLPRRKTPDDCRLEGGGKIMGDPRFSEEIKTMEYEPLIPAEKKLIAWSIILGVVLIGVLVWVSYTFFPAQH